MFYSQVLALLTIKTKKQSHGHHNVLSVKMDSQVPQESTDSGS